jgi:hypothetical protein
MTRAVTIIESRYQRMLQFDLPVVYFLSCPFAAEAAPTSY